MYLSRKHKVGSKCKIFLQKWTDEYFCVSMNGKALYLICSKSTTVLKEYNTAGHYNLKHKEKYKNCQCFEKRKVVAL
jgi:hypothetical protein